MIKHYRPLLVAAGLFLLGIALRRLLPKPYIWNFAFLCWAFGFGALAAWAGKSAGKYAGIVLMSLFLALFAAETWLSLDAPGQPEQHRRSVPIEDIRADRGEPDLQEHESNVLRKDPALGYRPKPERVRTAHRQTWDGRVISDVLYSTLPSGWRVTPQHPEAENAVVFFGCSVTYGLGLNDEETFPYKLGALLGSNWQVYNFAYTGYGSHQMLAQIQEGCLTDIVARHKRVVVFYVTVVSHEMRSAGVAGWDRYGPWYELENGALVRKGNFSEKPGQTMPRFRMWMRNCLVYQALFGTSHDQAAALELHAAIIAEADKELRGRYGLPLTVVLWPGAPFRKALEDRHVTCLDLGPLFPDYHSTEYLGRYLLPHDNHPNAAAADVVAGRLAEQIKEGQ